MSAPMFLTCHNPNPVVIDAPPIEYNPLRFGPVTVNVNFHRAGVLKNKWHLFAMPSTTNKSFVTAARVLASGLMAAAEGLLEAADKAEAENAPTGGTIPDAALEAANVTEQEATP